MLRWRSIEGSGEIKAVGVRTSCLPKLPEASPRKCSCRRSAARNTAAGRELSELDEQHAQLRGIRRAACIQHQNDRPNGRHGSRSIRHLVSRHARVRLPQSDHVLPAEQRHHWRNGLRCSPEREQRRGPPRRRLAWAPLRHARAEARDRRERRPQPDRLPAVRGRPRRGRRPTRSVRAAVHGAGAHDRGARRADCTAQRLDGRRPERRGGQAPRRSARGHLRPRLRHRQRHGRLLEPVRPRAALGARLPSECRRAGVLTPAA